MTALSLLADLYPWSVDPDEDLRRAVAFLGLSTTPADLLRASYGVGIVGAAVTFFTAVVAPPALKITLTLVGAILTLLGTYAVTAVVRLLATARRVRALGDAPDLVGRAVLSMRLSPSPERAAEFAAASSTTALGTSLARHVRQARASPTAALRSFGEEWDPWFPALGRSLQLVSTAGSMSGPDREETLDRALSVVLDGTREQLRSFSEDIRGPLTGLYAFGILLPTALVALLPAAHAGGLSVTPLTVGLVYDLLLPAGLGVATAWLLAHRPVTFPPPNVPRDHPDVPDRTAHAAGGGILVAGLAWLLASLLFPDWAPPIAALGIGSGTALLVYYRPVLSVYDHVRDIEEGLTDALSLVGRRVSNGRAVEAAVDDAPEELSGDIATVFEQAATQQRQLQVDIERAFLGEYGALTDVPSPRVTGSIAFLGHAASEGEPAGPAILALADHVDELRRVEAETRHTLQTVCGALQSTGALFGPLVAGATVALADGMVGGSGLASGGQSLPWLGLAVGWYVLVLAVLLPTLATGLVRGLDRALVGVRVGRALLAGTVVYLGSYLLVSGIA